MKPKPRVNNVDDTISEAATIGISATAGEQVNQVETMFNRHSIYDANYDSDYDEFDDNCVVLISDSDNIREMEPVNMHICIGNTETKALVDSGSVGTIINNSYQTKIIKTIGVINTSVKCSNWAAVKVNVTVVEDGHTPIIGRYLFPQVWTFLTQTKQVSNVNRNKCLIKKQMAFDFPGLISRIGK